MNNIILENRAVIYKNILSKSYLLECRNEILNFIKNNKTIQNAGGITIPDFIKRNLPKTSALKNSKNIQLCLKNAFGHNNFRFCSHNDIGINRIVGWHKDKLNGEYSKYQTKNIWDIYEGEKHEIFKLVIYLQDHSNDNNALKICKKTHLIKDNKTQNIEQLNPALGDIIIFDQRITHRGMEKQCNNPRIMISFGFGKNNIFTDEFEKGTILRQNKQNENITINKIIMNENITINQNITINNKKNIILKVAHIYASQAKTNSGDFILGPSTKKHFEQNIIKQKCEFTNFNCRDVKFFNSNSITKLNEFDYIIIGGGGLILPDSGPNKNSCWQWNIKKEQYKKITKPIYVISIGYNLFYGQNMSMPNRDNNRSEMNRISILRENLRTLISKSDYFTLRHKSDVENVIKIVGEKYRNKIKYEICPSVWYVNKYWKLPKQTKKYLAIEIKDDREWRRYHSIGKINYYKELEKIVKSYIQKNENICYLSHDGSNNFYRYLKSKNINIPYLDNSCANEEKIKENYSRIHTILCSAGHSQMISYGCGIRIISLVSHPKIKNFCDDIDNKEFIEINKTPSIFNIFNRLISHHEIDEINMSKYKNLHKGRDIYVIASGKSLDFMDTSFFDGKITIGINQVFKKMKCNYLVRKESALLKDCVENNKESIFFISRGMHGGDNNNNERIVKENNYKNVVIFGHNKNNSKLRVNNLIQEVDIQNDEIIVSYSTITSGIHLAAFMGAKNIILVGHDCGKINGKLNFSGYHTEKTYKIAWKDGEKGYEKWITSGVVEQDTIQLKHILKQIYGCNILSLNPFINFGLEGNSYER